MKRLALTATIAGLALASLACAAPAQTASQQRFTIIHIPHFKDVVIAKGKISAVGSETKNTHENVPQGHPFDLTFGFPGGDISSTDTPGRPHVSFDHKTCVAEISTTDNVAVTSGTGKYAGATGSQRAQVHVTDIFGHHPDGSCLGPNTTPVFELVLVHETGSINLR